MRSLKVAVTALVTASIALGAAAPAFADRDHGKHWRKHDRVVVIDRRDYRRDRHYYAPPRKVVYVRDRHYYAPPREVVYVREGDRHYYRDYDRHHHHRDHDDNTGEVLLGVGLGAAALAGILAATND